MWNWIQLSEQAYLRARRSRLAIIAALALTLIAGVSMLIALGGDRLLEPPASNPVASAGRGAG